MRGARACGVCVCCVSKSMRMSVCIVVRALLGREHHMHDASHLSLVCCPVEMVACLFANLPCRRRRSIPPLSLNVIDVVVQVVVRGRPMLWLQSKRTFSSLEGPSDLLSIYATALDATPTLAVA